MHLPLFAMLLDAADTIAEGGTKGLLYVLASATIVLGGVVGWLGRYALTEQKAATAKVEAIHVAHATALTAHTDKLTLLHERCATEIAKIQDQRVKEMAEITDAANALRETAELITARKGAK